MFSASPKRRSGSSSDGGAGSGDINRSPSEDLLGHEDPDVILAKHRIGKSKYTHFHVIVFIITFFSYAMLHANRKSFSNVKVLISEEWTPSSSNATERAKQPDSIWNAHTMFPDANDEGCKTFLGTLDTLFMVAYAVGLFISGPLGDRLNLRYVLCGGMVLTSFTIVLFACVSEWFQFYKIYWYIPLWILNGLFQSTAWPAVVAIMGNWFGKSHRGLIFGVWSANASVGNILGSLIVADFVDMGYELAMLVPAVLLLASAIIIWFGLVVSPAEIGIVVAKEEEPAAGEEAPILPTTSSFAGIAPPIAPPPNYSESIVVTPTRSGYNSTETGDNNEAPKRTGPKAVGFFEAVLLPGVIIYSVAYACLKLVNYSFFFWLPYYLNKQYHWSQALADTLSVWYDFGGIIGGILGGFISDKLRRAPVMAVMLIIALPLLFVYKEFPDNQLLNAVGLGLLGFFIGGVANIISAAVCADLGRQPKLRGSTSALATVTGILDGTGSAGAAIGQLLIPILEQAMGWDAVFYMFIVCTGLTAVCISPIVYRELRDSNLGHACRRCFSSSSGSVDRRSLLVHENGPESDAE